MQKKRIMNAKPKGFHVFIVDFDDTTYKNLKKHSKKKNIKSAELVKKIVVEWLKNHKGG